VRGEAPAAERPRTARSGTKRPRAVGATSAAADDTHAAPRTTRARRTSAAEASTLDPSGAALADALRAWRLAEAKKKRTPAFRVLTDQTLLGIAAESPRSTDALLAVRGFGPKLADKYAAAILAVVRRVSSEP